ncbi:YheC/D like ATP-grasp [Thermosyntropha lipolytica DSM 11003]|uniref:YheC/D like ATP-grasp n=1 Tax=Thermosyntropha lipolytica DSM 11003 TaxID=1123382 RepID=A0A1M5LBQ0_9FIRM|nr:YheC/YheD family protein [Thermosyntropha lipolytica]SHG62149.1 YheC/D like ATP-grasp [Thermosyntropha lipolytica DSM 11003]
MPVGKIIISGALAEKLSLAAVPEIKVRAGNITVISKLIIDRREDRLIYMVSPELAKKLYLKKKNRLHIRYDLLNKVLHIGPTIGILAASIPNQPEFDPKSTQAELIYLSKIGQKMPGQIFIFTPHGINWREKTVIGYNFKPTTPQHGIWVASTYPLPDVVYDRISSRRSEIKHRKTRERLKKTAYYFNPSFLNKWEVHEILISNPELHPYLPETRILSLYNLEQMLNKYKVLYIKPVDGSLGRKIIRLAGKEDDKKLHYTVYDKKHFKSQALNPADFIRKTSKVREKKAYIIQQGIDMADYKGSIFDLRIIYQKNGQGNWQISKKFVRVAPKGSGISNLSSGGKVQLSKKVMHYIFRSRDLIAEKNREIENLCYNVATTLEGSGKGIYGELGLDIGIDKKGHLWLIEVNSKPRKTTETELSMTIVKNTFKRPLEYAAYLAGFKISQ